MNQEKLTSLGLLVARLALGIINYFQQLAAGQEGFEYNLALIALSLTLFFAGPGAYALDAKFNLDFVARWLGMKKSQPAMAR